MNKEFFASATQEELETILRDTNVLQESLVQKIADMNSAKYSKLDLAVKGVFSLLQHLPERKKQLPIWDYVHSYRTVHLDLPRSVGKTFKLSSMYSHDNNSILLVPYSTRNRTNSSGVSLGEYWSMPRGLKSSPISKVLIDEPEFFNAQSLRDVLCDIIVSQYVADDFYVFSMGTPLGT